MSEIYERLENEPTTAFVAFQKYRDMEGEGSYAKVAQMLGKSTKVVERFAAAWRWQERLRAYLEHLDQQRLKNRDRELQEMRKRHATFGRALMNTGGKVIERVNQRLADNPKSELELDETLKMIHEGADLERKSLGIEEESGQRAQVSVDIAANLDAQKIYAKIRAVIGLGGPLEYRVEPEAKKEPEP